MTRTAPRRPATPGAALLFWTWFNTLGFGPARETEQWTETRFRFWLAFTLRSILDQQVEDWRYWLVCSRALRHLTEPLRKAITDPRVELVYDDECVGRLARLDPAERYLLTRVDSDDLYHRAAASTLLGARSRTPFLQFNHGFAVDAATADVLPWRSRSSPFYTHVYGEEVRRLDTWTEPDHTTVARSATVLGPGHFLVSLHGANTSTTRAHAAGPAYPAARSAAILEPFGIGGDRPLDELAATARVPVRWGPRLRELQAELAPLVEELNWAVGGRALSLPAAALLRLLSEMSAARTVGVVDDVAAGVVIRSWGAASCRLVESRPGTVASVAARLAPALAGHAIGTVEPLEPHGYDVVHVDLRRTEPDAVRSALRAVTPAGLFLVAGLQPDRSDVLRDLLGGPVVDRYPEIEDIACDASGTTCALLGRPLTGGGRAQRRPARRT